LAPVTITTLSLTLLWGHQQLQIESKTHHVETYGPTVSVAILGIFGTPSNDPRSAGLCGFASCSLNAVMRALVLIDIVEKSYSLW
jgi:hypothetical protein